MPSTAQYTLRRASNAALTDWLLHVVDNACRILSPVQKGRDNMLLHRCCMHKPLHVDMPPGLPNQHQSGTAGGDALLLSV